MALLFFALTLAWSNASPPNPDFAVWARECERLLSSGIARPAFHHLFPVRKAAMDVVRGMSPIHDEDIGHLRYVVDLARPISSAAWFHGFTDGQIDEGHQVRLPGTCWRKGPVTRLFNRLTKLDRKLEIISAGDLTPYLACAFDLSRVRRAGVTYAADFENGEVYVVSDVIIKEGGVFRVTSGQLVRLTTTSLALDRPAPSLEHFEFRHPRPSRGVVERALRRYLRLAEAGRTQTELKLSYSDGVFPVLFRRRGEATYNALRVTRPEEHRFVIGGPPCDE